MAEFKLVIANPKTGRCVQKEVKDENASGFLGKKIGEVVRGELFDMTGYEFKITGGSDHCGFPMRRDIDGPVRKKILLVSGVGAKPVKKKVRKGKPFQYFPGTRQRKTVCGNTIHEKITQLNLLVVKEGSTPLEAPVVPEADESAKVQQAEPKPEAPEVEKKEEASETKEPEQNEVKPSEPEASKEAPAKETPAEKE
jgi:small subunit ribosomal protein S6e